MNRNEFTFISHLYNYTCPPPYGSGSHTKLVAETVQRSILYAKKNPHPEDLKNYNGIPLYSQCQREGDPVVTLDPQGFFHKEQAQNMIYDFCSRYKNEIDQALNETVQWAHETSISEIGKGKQTLEVLSEQTIKASAALERFCIFLKDNNLPTDYTLITFCDMYWNLYDKEEIVYIDRGFKKVQKVEKNSRKKVYDKGRDFVYVRKNEKHVLKGREKDQFLFELLTPFETFRKDAERNKSKRRAIASPGIPLRCFFRIIEEFGKKICNKIPESTISVGGDEKKDKLQHMLNEVMNHSLEYPSRYIVTGDNQKWNECMSSELFIRTMRSICFFFDDFYEVQKDQSWYNRTLMYKIFETAFAALFHKKVRFGIGKKVVNKKMKLYKYISLKEIIAKIDEIPNEEEKEIYKELQDVLYTEFTAINSSGMLMGMLNILSTLIGLLGMTYNNKGQYDPLYRDYFKRGKIPKTWLRKDLTEQTEIPDESFLTKPVARTFCVQSSDDFFLIVAAVNDDIAREKIKETFANCKILGVNWSPAKTIIRKKITSGVGEYTSWFIHDDRLIPQWGTDTAQLRPNGINCQSDLSSGIRAILDKIQIRNMNYLGADIALRLLCRYLRILYYIQFGDTPMSLDPELVCFANGGNFKFTPSNLHFDETAILLEKHESWESDQKDTEEWKNFDKYIRRLVNPACPLNSGQKEVTEFDPDTMEQTTKEYGVIMNANNVQLRSNKKLTNKKLDENLRRETYSIVESVAVLIRPTLAAISSTAKVPMIDSLQERLQSRIDIINSKEDKTEVEKEIIEVSKRLQTMLNSLID